MYVQGMRALYAFEGCVVSEIKMDPFIAEVKLRRDRRRALWCGGCGGRMTRSREVPQFARDPALGPLPMVLIRYPAVQGRCRRCGRYETVHPPGIEPRHRATWRLMRHVSRLCRFMPVERVPELVPVDPTVIRRWDRKVLRETLPEPDLDDLEVLLIDEKSIGRHHQYVTLVMNGVTGELLHMAEGKKKQSLEAFFDRLTPEQAGRIRAVGIDRSGAYREVIRERIPGAEVVYDKFHLIQNYNKVIDEVRRREWRKARADEKPVIKGRRYILLKNPENRTERDNERLAELIDLNRNIATVEMLKDDLRQLWAYRYRAWAERWLRRWADWAMSTSIEPVRRFARGLLAAKDEVLAYCKHRITTARLEGFNNLISRAIHRACGVRDLHYLFLKLRQESLPDPAERLQN
jgi:transposase